MHQGAAGPGDEVAQRPGQASVPACPAVAAPRHKGRLAREHGGNQRWDHLWRVLQVRIHDDDYRAPGQAETLLHSTTEPSGAGALLTVQQPDWPSLVGQTTDQLRGRVVGIVDEHELPAARGGPEGGSQAARQRLDVRRFIARGDHDRQSQRPVGLVVAVVVVPATTATAGVLRRDRHWLPSRTYATPAIRPWPSIDAH